MAPLTSADFDAEVAKSADVLEKHLVGASSILEIALARGVFTTKREEWSTAKRKTYIVRNYGSKGQEGLRLWHNHAVKLAENACRWEKQSSSNATIWSNRQKDYEQLVSTVTRDITRLWGVYQQIADPERATLFRKTQQTGNYTKNLQTAFATWYKAQRVTLTLVKQDRERVAATFLRQHLELVAALKTAHSPETPSGQPDRKLAVDAMEIQLALTAALGTSFNLYPAWQARQLLMYPSMSEVERAVCAMTIIVSLAGRLVKAGRIFYTAKRLSDVFGGEEATWKRAIAYSSLLFANRSAESALDNAIKEMRSTSKMSANTKQTALTALNAAVYPVQSGTFVDPVALEPMVEALWKTLTSSAYPWLSQSSAFLDEYALRRILTVGPNLSNMKCQILAELAESYFGVILRDNLGSYALGIDVPRDCFLQYIPGHAIRVPYNTKDVRPWQVTDGLFGYFQGGIFYVSAIVEIMIDGLGSRELQFVKTDLKKLTRGERMQLRCFANKAWLEVKEAVERKGQTFSQDEDSFQQPIIDEELVSQITNRDVARLIKLTTLQINGIDTEFRIFQDPKSPQATTKILGVTARGVEPDEVRGEVAKANTGQPAPFQFEPFGLPFNMPDIAQLSKDLRNTAIRLMYPLPVEKDKPVSTSVFLDYIKKIYDLAVLYKPTADGYYNPEIGMVPFEPNQAVMQWLRHEDYTNAAFEEAVGPIDQSWIDHVSKNGITIIRNVEDPKYPTNIHASHLGASLDGVYQHYPFSDDTNIGDVLGWLGDLTSFFVEWQKENHSSPVSPSDFFHERFAWYSYKPIYETSAKMRDMIEDADAYNIGIILAASPTKSIANVMREYYKPGGAWETRFGSFYKARFGGTVKGAASLTKKFFEASIIGSPRIRAFMYAIMWNQGKNSHYTSWDSPGDRSASEIDSYCQGFAEVLQEMADAD